MKTMKTKASHPVLPQKPLVIYHGNCADGFSAAWCFWKKFKDDYEYHPGVYSQKPPDVTNRNVFLVDFSYSREIVADMLTKAKTVTLIDHHETAIKNLTGLTGLIQRTSLDKSGAILAWEYVHGTTCPPVLLEYIQDRDLWKFKLALSKEVNSYVFSHDYSFETWDKLMTLKSPELLSISVAGAAIMRKHEKDVKELVSFSRRKMTIGGYIVPVANLPYTMASDAAGEMATEFPFAATYIDTDEHRIFSLRSRKDSSTWINVAEIAEGYGGGGHEHASGFRVDRNHPLAKE